MEETLFCLRVRYSETGRLRYLSHLELLRATERIIRRARLPYAITQGFNPRIKAAYCPALPVGVGSADEWFDVWLTEYVPAPELLERLKDAAPPDLQPCEAAYVAVHGPSLSAVLTLATWEVGLDWWPGTQTWCPGFKRPAITREAVQRAWELASAAGELTYDRSGKPKTVKLEGKFADAVVFHDDPAPFQVKLRFTTRSSNEGALRPDVWMQALAAQLAECLTAEGEPYGASVPDDVPLKALLHTDITRVAQYLEGDNGLWERPI